MKQKITDKKTQIAVSSNTLRMLRIRKAEQGSTNYDEVISELLRGIK